MSTDLAWVTAISENRRQYTYYLDDNETEDYHFNGYVSANPALRKQVDDSLGLDFFVLSHYPRLNAPLKSVVFMENVYLPPFSLPAASM